MTSARANRRSVYFVFNEMDFLASLGSSRRVGFDWLCYFGFNPAALQSVWVGLRRCRPALDKTSVCVCACGGCVCVPVSSLTAESAESTDGPTGARSKSLCMQIKKATINVAKEQGGHGGFMAPLSLFFLPPPPPPSSTVWWGLREDLEWDTQSAELSPVCSVCARLPRHGVRMKSVRASQPSQLASEWATERAPLV